MTGYKQLTQEQRYKLEGLFGAGATCKFAAEQMPCHPSTITKELRRNGLTAATKRLYKASAFCGANSGTKGEDACGDKPKRGRTLIPQASWDYLEHRLKLNHSPEQICGRWESDARMPSVSWAYKYIERRYREGADFYANLRILKKPHSRKPKNKNELRGRIPDRVDISERPSYADDRSVFGHWEGDLVHVKSGYLVTLNERVSRAALVGFVKNKDSESVMRELVRLLRPYEAFAETLTLDNGLEFAKHGEVARRIGCKVYFCRPYHSWERGANENMNGLLRQYFPKGEYCPEPSRYRLKKVQDSLNARPRKRLDFQTPRERFLLHSNGREIALAS